MTSQNLTVMQSRCLKLQEHQDIKQVSEVSEIDGNAR